MVNSVLLVTPRFPPDTGGVEQYVFNVARHLVRRTSLRVTVVTTAKPPGRGSAEPIDADGLRVYRLRRDYTLSNTPVGVGWVRQISEIVRREQVDLINAHAPVPGLADVAARASGQLPFVLTYHNASLRKGRWLPDVLVRGYERFVLPATIRRADRVICSSDFVAAYLADQCAEKLATVSPGADLELYTPAPLPDEAWRVVFVASLHHSTRYKGLTDLLDAVARLRRAGRPVQLDVVGDGDDNGFYPQRARRLGVEDVVHFRGRLTGTDLVDAYHAAGLMALPTHYDSFPTVLVEAMACGRPVISTPVGGIPTFVADEVNGLLVQPGDVGELADALDRLIADRDLAARLAAAGRRKVVAELSWERQAQRTLEVYESAERARQRSASMRSGSA